MDDAEQLESYSFRLSPTQYAFLTEINDQPAKALRTLLDSLIRTNKKIVLKKVIDEILIFICLGLLFTVLSLLSNDIPIIIICVLIGMFLLTYGLIGGILYVIPRSKRTTE